MDSSIKVPDIEILRSSGQHYICLKPDEAKAIAGCLRTQYLPYDNEALHQAVNKLFRMLERYDKEWAENNESN